MTRLSRILSTLFSPLLMPTIGMIAVVTLSIMSVLPARVLFTAVCVTFVMTCLIPLACIFTLYRMGYAKDPGLNEQGDRTVPYFIAIMSYLGCAFFFYRSGAPIWVVNFLNGGATAILINMLVNFKWKISGHSAAMGGLVALFFRLQASHVAVYDMNLWISGVLLLAGVVMTSRIYLGRHTLWQTLAGAANGYLCVWFMSMLH
ncbi:MAG: phosphatase PAP2 family protein [Duncaniella sp.]|nr:phosphatase PAP2 family protein [Duncaniella sp.]